MALYKKYFQNELNEEHIGNVIIATDKKWRKNKAP